MSKVDIENYRGIAVWFDTDNESFQCDIDDSRSIKKSYSAIKKFIDDWKKENSDFKPFNIEPVPGRGYIKYKRIVGIRKDNRFIVEDDNGNKSQLSDYNETDYMIVDSSNKSLWLELNEVGKEIEALRAKDKELRSQFRIVTVRDVKPNYL